MATLAGFRMATEPMLASAARRSSAVDGAVDHKNAIFLDSNENPLGPCAAARQAITAITPNGGRYLDDLSDQLVKLFAQQEGLKTDYVRLFAGSSEPLHYTVLAFTSPSRSYVTADPGFEAGIFMSKVSGARVVAVPLTKSFAHDVRAMVASASDAGAIYICNPNNPTGTLTEHSEIEYVVEKKPKDAVVLVDEAYLHFSDAISAVDLVKADKDVIVRGDPGARDRRSGCLARCARSVITVARAAARHRSHEADVSRAVGQRRQRHASAAARYPPIASSRTKPVMRTRSLRPHR